MVSDGFHVKFSELSKAPSKSSSVLVVPRYDSSVVTSGTHVGHRW